MCNIDPKEVAAIFTLLQQVIETRVWKKVRSITEVENCRLRCELG